jgi:methylenetetrahydrofolate reductase (NADPH)
MSVAAEGSQANGLRQRLDGFVAHVSTEITSHDDDVVASLAATLPPGTIVYVAHTPKSTLDDVVRVALEVQAAGLRASPHLVARRIGSVAELARAASGLRGAGVEQVLVIAGDSPPGRRDPTAVPSSCSKVACSSRRASTVSVWRVIRRGIRLPVHAGMAGPTPLPRLIKYAMACGVGASVRGAMRNLKAMTGLAGLATSAEEMLIGLARGRDSVPSARIVQPHVFAFGGSVATARWLRALLDGSYELRDARLTVRTG